MKGEIDLYFIILFFILTIVASIIAFNIVMKTNNFNQKNESIIDCKTIEKYYYSNTNITIEGYLYGNCTVGGTLIPSGHRIIKIINGKIYYI